MLVWFQGLVLPRVGNRVTCVDIDPIKIEKLNKGVHSYF